MKTLLALLLACSAPPPASAEDGSPPAPPLEAGQAEAIFAGGCFWCMEKPFDKIEGVLATTSGYTGGERPSPTYAQVSRHETQHREALRVVYDPTKVTYDRLLEVFWHNVDPTQEDGQFCDRGHQYTSAIYVASPEERAAAEASKAKAAETLGQTLVTPILEASTFWVAEDYHQDFYTKDPVRYTSYRRGCGRDARLKQLWGDAAGH